MSDVRPPGQSSPVSQNLINVSTVVSGITGALAFIVAVVVMAIRPEWNVSIQIATLIVCSLMVLVSVYAAIMSILLTRARDLASFLFGETLAWRAQAADASRMAYIDVVTGLPNALALEKKFDGDGESKHSHCLILLDLNDFRTINKRCGYWDGDRYLRAFAQKINSMGRRDEHTFSRARVGISEVDKFSRLREKVEIYRKYPGGDEFYVLLSGDVFQGIGFLNRLVGTRRQFESISMKILHGQHYKGFTAGLVTFAGADVKIAMKAVVDRLRQAERRECPFFVFWEPTELNERDLFLWQVELLAKARNQFAK